MIMISLSEVVALVQPFIWESKNTEIKLRDAFLGSSHFEKESYSARFPGPIASGHILGLGGNLYEVACITKKLTLQPTF